MEIVQQGGKLFSNLKIDLLGGGAIPSLEALSKQCRCVASTYVSPQRAQSLPSFFC